MSEHYSFGFDSGHLPARADKIARKYGARLVNFTFPGCSCGHGCHDECPENRRHWFRVIRYDSFDLGMVDVVMEKVAAAREAYKLCEFK